MKTDKELLMLAAKAAGHSSQSLLITAGDALIGIYLRNDQVKWNPLTDDGDALRLAVDLEMDVTLQTNNKTVTAWGYVAGVSIFSKSENYGSDKHAATRRAIVRAAAAIGEAME